MKLRSIALASLISFSLATPHKAQAIISPIALIQIGAGSFTAACTTKLVLWLRDYYKAKPEERLKKFSVNLDLPLVIGCASTGAVATLTCLLAGYQGL